MAGQLDIAVQVPDQQARLCPDHPCQVDITRLRFASDGSAWVAAHVWSAGLAIPDKTWLAHFAKDGTRLAETLTEGAYDSQLTLDDRDQVWVVTSTDEPVWRLRRFDATLTEVAAPIPVRPLYSLVSLPAQGVVMLSIDRPPRLTALGFEGELLWSRATDLGIHAAALAVSTDGFASLNQVDRSPDFGTLSVTGYDPMGTPRWNTETGVAFAGPSSPSFALVDWMYFYAFDSHSNLVLGVVPPDPTEAGSALADGLSDKIDLESIGPDGESRWSLRVSSAINLGVAIGPHDDVWVADFQRWRSHNESGSTPSGNIQVISETGTTCTRYAYTGIERLSALEFSPTGELWFAERHSFGRFTLPAP